MSASPAPSAPLSLLSQDQDALLERLTGNLYGAGLWWLSGYAAGLARAQVLPSARPAALVAAEIQTEPQLTIVYGSQTGNAKRMAEQLARQMEAAGLGARLLRADAYPTRGLQNERYLAIVISTQGDGEPPDDARGFVDFLAGKRAPQLPGLHYAVLGLGDSSYPQFCAIGRKLDERLAELGAKRWFARGEADLDIDTVATPWFATALTAAKEALKPQVPLATVTPLRPLTVASGACSRDHPFPAELLVNQRITGRGRNGLVNSRDIRHIELSLEGSGLQYEAGDALGIWPVNPPRLVDAVLATLQLDGEQAIAAQNGEIRSLREWLERKRELTRLSRPFIAAHALRARSAALNDLLAPGNSAALTRLLADQQIIDLLRAYPGAWTGEELVAALRPLTPRLYSIASSPKAVGEEAHLTVAHIEYDVDGSGSDESRRWGAASNFLARAAEGEKLPIFIESNERFRLPKDGSCDVILIGPGTGVAPFRGFVQERAATGASGRNWLFFGNPHARGDFLYQLEWQEALKRGELHRLDLAFSRDQAHKLYVQDRLREHGREVHAWLEGGAYLYVCGDATRMAKDVHAELLALIAHHGAKSAEDAQEYLNQLQSQGRYARDVY